MGEVVNFNKFKKAKTKADKTQRAEENRAKFGRTKAEKALDEHVQSTHQRTVDAHKRETDENAENSED